MHAPENKIEAVEKVAELIKGIKFTMLTTIGSDGKLYSRPMTTQDDDFNGTLWFFTTKDNSLAADVEKEQDVSLAYADPEKSRYVAVTGTANLTTDKAKMQELWKPALKAWFPEGLETPDIALLKVVVEKAEFWDSPGSAVVQIVGFAKAVLTGESYKPSAGEHQRVNLQ